MLPTITQIAISGYIKSVALNEDDNFVRAAIVVIFGLVTENIENNLTKEDRYFLKSINPKTVYHQRIRPGGISQVDDTNDIMIHKAMQSVKNNLKDTKSIVIGGPIFTEDYWNAFKVTKIRKSNK